LPLLHPGGRPNLAPGLIDALAAIAGRSLSAEDVAAYVAGIVSHPGYVEHFADELTTPGIRVPITTSAKLFNEAVELGRQVIWLHTYGASLANPAAGRPTDDIRLPATDPARVTNQAAVTDMPDAITYDPATGTVHVGATGTFGPITEATWSYTVGGRNVIRSWFNYRKKIPGGRKSSPLDTIHPDVWPSDWNSELIDLLTVLNRLTTIHNQQKPLLDAILDGAIASSTDLTALGVTWPGGNTDKLRKPDDDFVVSEPRSSGQLGFDFR